MRKRRFNLRAGDVVKIGRTSYCLERRLGGGFQFRTWIVTGRGNRSYVAKLSNDVDSVKHEAAIYRTLRRRGVPNRYYPELVTSVTDQCVSVLRGGEEIGHVNGLIMKYYPYMSLSEYLASKPPRQERERVAGKLLRRVNTINQLGILHKDLHVNNVLVRRTRKGYVGVRIIDFGLSLTKAGPKELRNEQNRLARLVRRIKGARQGHKT
jgi:serine/threonine protein kinase